MSNVRGVWSAFPINERLYWCLLRSAMINDWNFWSLCSKFSGSFWAMDVFDELRSCFGPWSDGTFLLTDWELSNEDDKFAVGIYETNSTGNKPMGHLPAEFSRIACYFIKNSGEISCQVTGKRVHSQGPQGGMAIPYKLQWTSLNKKHASNLDKLITAKRSKILGRYGLI